MLATLNTRDTLLISELEAKMNALGETQLARRVNMEDGTMSVVVATGSTPYAYRVYFADTDAGIVFKNTLYRKENTAHEDACAFVDFDPL